MSNINPRVKERKRKLAKLMFQGVGLDRACDILVEEEGFDVKKDTIKQDWYRRDNWIGNVFDIKAESAEKLIMEIIAEEKVVKSAGWKLFEETDNSNAQLGSLKMVSSINQDILEMLIDAGLVELDSDSDALMKTLEKMDEVLNDGEDE